MQRHASAEVLGDGSRFVVQGVLGQGASGTVYRAYDHVRHASVAVKVLSQVDPGTLFRFKGEFRTLADLSHPNLLKLYELVLHGDQWLLTMELVEGRDFLSFVRPSGPRNEVATERDITPNHPQPSKEVDLDAHTQSDGELADLKDARSAEPPLDAQRLRDALRQLAEGLRALHRSGRLHRDLKPANVLVFDATGRTVICDFGLALETGAQSRAGHGSFEDKAFNSVSASSTVIAGTLPYMSPEQSMGLPLNEASDWYAVGIMLYQALTGRPPFDLRLTHRAAIAAKLLQSPVHPLEVNPGLPSDLAQLALGLLAPVPAFRFGYRELMRACGQREEMAIRTSRAPAAPDRAPRLVGREKEFLMLHQALRRVNSAGASMVFVTGPTGVGKSALVDVFLDDAEAAGCLVLSGRCYEREQVPYKAFDPIMDALSSYLLKLEDDALAKLLPHGTDALKQLFPVLQRVPAIRDLVSDVSASGDAFEVRRHAFAALRELLKRLSAEKPLVIYIDDLQWGDLDSAPLFVELLRGPQAPALLLTCAYRSEEEDLSPLIKLLRGTYLKDLGIATPQTIALKNLSTEHSQELALSLVSDLEDAAMAASRIAEEAHGSPFFVAELAAHVRTAGRSSTRDLKLESLIAARIDELPPECWRLLSLIVVAGRPEPIALFHETARLEGSFLASLSFLEAQHLVRTTGPDMTDRVDVYHQQIRMAAYGKLRDEQRKDAHRRLAEVLERAEHPDHDALFRHWQSAGNRERALAHALKAAEAAETSVAYESAAALYEAALTLEPNADQRQTLMERRGHALMCAGHGIEAARCYFDALEGAAPERAAELRGLAISQLLRAGQIDTALTELARAKDVLGVPLPQSERQAVRMLFWRRLLGWFQSDRLHVGASHARDPVLDGRMAMLWTLGTTLSSVDILRGSLYQLEFVRVARKSGDAHHLACALALSTTTLAAEGKATARVDWLAERALEFAGVSGHSHALPSVKGALGVTRYLQGRFAEGARLTHEAQVLLRQPQNVHYTWDRVALTFFEMACAAMIGRVNELVTRVPEALRDAEARGDLLGATLFRSFRSSWAHLGMDEPERAREQAERAEQTWSRQSYSLQQFYVTHALVETALYTGTNLQAAWERIEAEGKRPLFPRQLQLLRVELAWLRGRMAVALANQTGKRDLLEVARRETVSLERERVPYASALGKLLAAGVLGPAGASETMRLLQEAAGMLEATDMLLLTCVGRSLAARLGGDEGLEQLALADMRALGVRQPARFVRMLAPEFEGG